MTRTDPDWAYLIDDSGRHWYHFPNGQKKETEEKGFRPPSKALYAISTEDLVSIPQWVSSKESEIIDEVVSIEVERIGVRAADGPGKTTEWKTVELNGTKTLVQSVTIPWALTELESSEDVFTRFIPQYALFAPPENSIVIWTEENTWVAGYSRGPRWTHVQTLDGSSSEAIAQEILLTLLELSAKDVIDTLEQIVVWTPFDPRLGQALEDATDLKVVFEDKPSPSSRLPEWSLEPHAVSENRMATTRKKRTSLIATLAIVALTFLVGAAFFHLWMLERSNQELRQLISENKVAAEAIQTSMSRWESLAPAIETRLSPLEIFHQVSVLLPEKGFRLTSFKIENNYTVSIRGEASSVPLGLNIRKEIENAPGLADFAWEIDPPTPKDGLAEFVATGTYLHAVNEEE